MSRNVYTDNGYRSREDYIRSLAQDYRIDIRIVWKVADMLGEENDFYALPRELRNIA